MVSLQTSLFSLLSIISFLYNERLEEQSQKLFNYTPRLQLYDLLQAQ